MANEKNLKSLKTRTTSERREIARKGGIASGEARRERKTIAELIRIALDQPIAEGSQQTRAESLVLKTMNKCYNDPDIRNLKVLAELLGEYKQEVHHEGSITQYLVTKEEQAIYDKHSK